MTKPKGFKEYFLLVGNETPAFLCQLENQEGKVIVWVVGAVGGAEQLYSHAVGTGDAPHRAGLGNWGISGPGAADQSMDSQHGLLLFSPMQHRRLLCKGPGQKSCPGFESHCPEKLH